MAKRCWLCDRRFELHENLIRHVFLEHLPPNYSLYDDSTPRVCWCGFESFVLVGIGRWETHCLGLSLGRDNTKFFGSPLSVHCIKRHWLQHAMGVTT